MCRKVPNSGEKPKTPAQRALVTLSTCLRRHLATNRRPTPSRRLAIRPSTLHARTDRRPKPTTTPQRRPTQLTYRQNPSSRALCWQTRAFAARVSWFASGCSRLLAGFATARESGDFGGFTSSASILTTSTFIVANNDYAVYQHIQRGFYRRSLSKVTVKGKTGDWAIVKATFAEPLQPPSPSFAGARAVSAGHGGCLLVFAGARALRASRNHGAENHGHRRRRYRRKARREGGAHLCEIRALPGLVGQRPDENQRPDGRE